MSSMAISAFSIPNPVTPFNPVNPGKPVVSPIQTTFGEERPIRRHRVVRFSGEELKKAGQRGLFVTTERPPAMVGGLGIVSKSIPEAIARYSDVDIRVIQPYLKPMAKADKENQNRMEKYQTADGKTVELPAWSEPTNAAVTLEAPLGAEGTHREITFRVRQKFEPVLDEQRRLIPDPKNPYGYKGNVIYSLQDEDGLYEGLDDLYYDYGKFDPVKYNPRVVAEVGYDPQFKLIMLYNRAAAAVMPLLNASYRLPDPDAGEAWLNQFVGDEDFVIANDWLTGPMLKELPEDYKVGKVFMLHNHYDMGRDYETALYNKLHIQSEQKEDGYYSPLTAGIEAADVMIGDRNYIRSITELGLGNGAPFVSVMKDKLANNRVVNMHHGLTHDFNPYNNLALRPMKSDKADYGYKELEKTPEGTVTQEAMKAYKAANKKALQQELGLKNDPKAVVINWTPRFDPTQKGFYLFMNAAEKFLKKYPHAQLVVVNRNIGHYPQIDAWMEKMKSNPDFKGRLYLPGTVMPQHMMARITAGSDFSIMTSLYEPYGLTQLEAMKLGAIPIGHSVDGIASTVLDPEINGTPEERQKWHVPDEKYGQTGVLMKPLQVRAYQKVIERQDAAYRRLMGLDDGTVSLKQKMQDKLRISSAKSRASKDPNMQPSIENWLIAENMLSKSDQAILKDAQARFDEALDRAMALAENPDDATRVRLNGLRFVETEHDWSRWAKQYAKAFAMADEANKRRLELTA
jgi:glycogen synthase